ncbi:ArsR/SmtB family transcription factor [Vaginisenegalia massiliensis]|uniref:ArsR/SmtB family transcription factor n=1 Tax=Vaginisenegalia massiliensis TaxID=2058294 RepID=UPI000F54B771|nr:metalloregulator ArsR/SmtB family transcription factor [Vaginisenegalia massiliensis]
MSTNDQPHQAPSLNFDEYSLGVEEIATVCAALSEEIRVKIFLLLSNREMSVMEVADYFGLSTANASHHLIVLKRSKLLNCERKGRERIYHLNIDYVELSKQIIRQLTK